MKNEKEIFVRRKKKESNFTIIPNEILNNENLSWKAKGLLCYMLSKPDDWNFYETELVKHSQKDGLSSLRSAMKELKETGYVTKEPLRDENGKIIKWLTYVSEDSSQISKSPHLVNSTCSETNNVENRTLLSTDVLPSTESLPSNELKQTSQQVASELENQFDTFWDLYKKKGSRKKSFDKFVKLIKIHSFEKVMNHTHKYMEFVFKQYGSYQFQKNCETFLNNFDLRDEFIVTKKQGGYNNGWNERPNEDNGFKKQFGVDIGF